MQHFLEEFQDSLWQLSLSAGTDQAAIGNHTGQALVQHCLQGFKGSLLQRALRASTDQSIVGDPVWKEALVQRCLQ